MSAVFYYGSKTSSGINLATNSSTAVQFSSGNLTGFVFGHIQVQGGTHYVTYDGTTPSSSNGEVVLQNEIGDFLAKDLLKMKFIAASGVTGNVFLQPTVYIDAGNANALT